MARGFTIFELIIVMVIIGLLTLMAIPRMINVGTISSHESAYQVAADIRKAQELAMTDTVSHQIQFTHNSSSYVIDPGTPNAQTINLPPGVTIGTNRTITFNTYGDPGNSEITINVGGDTVVVTQETGKVTVNAGS